MTKYILLAFLLLFSACSTKQFYEAKNTSSVKTNIISTPSYIKNINSVGATLEDNRYLDKNGISNSKLKDGYFFINNSNNDIISANKSYEVYINNAKHLKFQNNVIAASLEGDLIALVFSNNVIALYDIKTNTYKLKNYSKPSFVNDTRIAMPIFLNSIILFPTLDGKIIVVNKSTFQISKTINIDPSSEVNNIILMKNINNNLIVATSNIISSISQNNFIKKEFFIQSYITSDKYIYIATLDGRIIKLDEDLNILASKKYRFAKFQALSLSKTNLLAIESQGYIIKLDLDLKNESIDKISFEDDEKTFSSDSKIYFENKLLQF